MEIASVYMFNVQVTFDAETRSLSMGGEDFPLSVPQGIGIISFELTTINGGDTQASFNSNPIQWFASGSPIASPGAFLVQWFRPRHFSVIDFNSTIEEQPHPFNVVVSYEGKTYGSDPVIVNEPPAPT